MTAQRRRTLPWSGIWSALGVLVAAAGISQRSLWQDEAITAGLAHGGRSGLWDGIVADRGNMSLYYVIEAILAPVSTSDVWLRLPSALAFGVMVGLLWRLSNRTAGPVVAHTTAALAVTSSALVYYAQEARSYSATAAIAVATVWALDRVLRASTQRGWGLVVGLGVIGAYLHVVILLFLPGIFVLGFMRSGTTDRKAVVVAALLGVVACSPLVVGVAAGGDEQVAWLPPLSLSALARIAVALTGSHFVNNRVMLAGVLAFALALSAIVGARAVIDRRCRILRAGPNLAGGLSQQEIMIVGLVAPLALMLVASLASPLTAPRYYIHMVPFVLFLAAIGITAIQRPFAAGSLLVCIVVLGALRLESTFEQEDVRWSELSAFVEQNASDGDIVHATTYWERAPFDWYHWRDGDAQLLGLPPRQSIGVPQHPYPDEVGEFDLRGTTIYVIESEGDAEAVAAFARDRGTPYSVIEVASFGTATVTVIRFR